MWWFRRHEPEGVGGGDQPLWGALACDTRRAGRAELVGPVGSNGALSFRGTGWGKDVLCMSPSFLLHTGRNQKPREGKPSASSHPARQLSAAWATGWACTRGARGKDRWGDRATAGRQQSPDQEEPRIWLPPRHLDFQQTPLDEFPLGSQAGQGGLAHPAPSAQGPEEAPWAGVR